MRLWAVETGQCLRVFNNGRVRGLDLDARNERVLCAELDHSLQCWDLKVGRCLQVLEGHTDGVYSASFDPTQRRALSGSRDTTLRLWDLETGRCLRVFSGHNYHVHSVRWNMDGASSSLLRSRDTSPF